METEIKFISMHPVSIIEELERLNTISKLGFDEVKEQQESFKYPYLQHYLGNILYSGKPETATAELLRHLVEDVLHEEGFSEVKIKAGFADLIIQEKKVNPLVIELKPGFIRTEDKHGKTNGIAANKLIYSEHQSQVQKYLTANDYIILTDLRDACLFNREALVYYKPFFRSPLPNCCACTSKTIVSGITSGGLKISM